jgi:hypothetical protein
LRSYLCRIRNCKEDLVKSWTAVLGLGAACAACCAIPLLGAAGGLASFGSALAACADELLPAAGVLLALALSGAWWWRRRQAQRRAACACPATCSMEAGHACG